VKSCGTLPLLEVTYAFKKFSCKNSQFENLNDAHNIDAYVCNLLSLAGTNYFFHEKSRIGVCFSAASSQRRSVRISHGSGKPRPNDRNIVGCNMLCAFGHPVATFWGLLAQS